jgi:hypothetical protein
MPAKHANERKKKFLLSLGHADCPTPWLIASHFSFRVFRVFAGKILNKSLISYIKLDKLRRDLLFGFCERVYHIDLQHVVARWQIPPKAERPF